jgi:hypothetical protein
MSPLLFAEVATVLSGRQDDETLQKGSHQNAHVSLLKSVRADDAVEPLQKPDGEDIDMESDLSCESGEESSDCSGALSLACARHLHLARENKEPSVAADGRQYKTLHGHEYTRFFFVCVM